MAGDIVYNPQKYRSLGSPGGVANSASNGATGTVGAVAAALPAIANKLNWLTGIAFGRIGGAGATVTITGLLNGNLSFVSQPGQSASIQFDPPLPGVTTLVSGVPTGSAITVTSAADGTATSVAVDAVGFSA